MIHLYNAEIRPTHWPLFTKSKTTFDSDHKHDKMIWAEMHLKANTIVFFIVALKKFNRICILYSFYNW